MLRVFVPAGLLGVAALVAWLAIGSNENEWGVLSKSEQLVGTTMAVIAILLLVAGALVHSLGSAFGASVIPVAGLLAALVYILSTTLLRLAAHLRRRGSQHTGA